jgi:hypothetical protein
MDTELASITLSYVVAPTPANRRALCGVYLAEEPPPNDFLIGPAPAHKLPSLAVLKSSQQLLSHPRRSQEPAALNAVFNFQTRRHGDLFFFKMRNQFNATTSTFPYQPSAANQHFIPLFVAAPGAFF